MKLQIEKVMQGGAGSREVLPFQMPVTTSTIENTQSSQDLHNIAWELFEVGSYDEVIRLAGKNPRNESLHYMKILSMYENGIRPIQEEISIFLDISPGKTVQSGLLGKIVESYSKYYKFQYAESAKLAHSYFKSSNPLISFSLINFGIKVFRHAGSFKECLEIIQLYKNKYKDNSFIREEVEALFYLKRYAELLNKFKEKALELMDKEMHMMLGLSLFYLGKTSEATSILEKIPEKLELPSFEEKKKSYAKIISNIPDLEKVKEKMNHNQLAELGFAYLFNEDFKKAEEIFSQAITSAHSPVMA